MYSVEHLRAVYIDLLYHIDRYDRISDEDALHHKQMMRFSFRPANGSSSINFGKSVSNINTGSKGNKGNKSSSTSISSTIFNNMCLDDESRDVPYTEHFFVVQSLSATTTTTVGGNAGANTRISGNNMTRIADFVDLATALKICSATRSPYTKDVGVGGGSAFVVIVADDSLSNNGNKNNNVCGIQQVKALERRVVELIATIGEIVINRDNDGDDKYLRRYRQRSLSSLSCHNIKIDPILEYFFERSILSLLVDIVKEARESKSHVDLQNSSETICKSPLSSTPSVHGVVWCAGVKAQVVQTVSSLIVNVRNQSMTYYMLSNNHINDLIGCILPLGQWTEPAVTVLLPVYVDLLKNITLRLADDPHLFPFLIVGNENDNHNEMPSITTSGTSKKFPLLTAAIETSNNYFAQSVPQTYAKCLSVIINMMNLPDPSIQNWIGRSKKSQEALANHLCQRLLGRFQRMVNLTRGPVVDQERHKSIASQLDSLKDEMNVVHEIFCSEVRGMDVCLCELLLQRIVSVLLCNLSQSSRNRPLVNKLGVIDADVIPESEALAHVSTIFISFMFSNLRYMPFLRMLSVALFHPISTPIWSTFQEDEQRTTVGIKPKEYLLMTALNDIVSGVESVETCKNPYREDLMKTIRGDYGEYRATAAACLLQRVLIADTADLDHDVLKMLNSKSDSADCNDSSVSIHTSLSLEGSIAIFLSRTNKPSVITLQALQCIGYLSYLMLHHQIVNSAKVKKKGKNKTMIKKLLLGSVIWEAVVKAHDGFCENLTQYRNDSGVSDAFLDLAEDVIKSRYIPRYGDSNQPVFSCLIYRYGFAENILDANLLVRQFRGTSWNDTESTRFYIIVTLFFRSLCKMIDCFYCALEAETNPTFSFLKRFQFHNINLRLVHDADDLLKAVGGLTNGNSKRSSHFGSNDKIYFRFQSAFDYFGKKSKAISMMVEDNDLETKKQETRNVMEFSSAQFSLLVLSQMGIFILRPTKKHPISKKNSGMKYCEISLRNVIGAASDGRWLHIAVRNTDIESLTKNGNMALLFENSATCSIAKRQLDHSRETLRHEILKKVDALFSSRISSTPE